MNFSKSSFVIAIWVLFYLTSYAQNDPRQIQSSPLCIKTIINNTSTGIVEPTTHRLIPKFGTATVNVNCQISQQKQRLGTFFVTYSGHTANYQYRPDGSVILTLAGNITRPNSITCSGCAGSVGIPVTITTATRTFNTTVNSVAQFSDCDATGTCVCVPCPVQTTTLFNSNAISATAISDTGTALTNTNL